MERSLGIGAGSSTCFVCRFFRGCREDKWGCRPSYRRKHRRISNFDHDSSLLGADPGDLTKQTKTRHVRSRGGVEGCTIIVLYTRHYYNFTDICRKCRALIVVPFGYVPVCGSALVSVFAILAGRNLNVRVLTVNEVQRRTYSYTVLPRILPSGYGSELKWDKCDNMEKYKKISSGF